MVKLTLREAQSEAERLRAEARREVETIGEAVRRAHAARVRAPAIHLEIVEEGGHSAIFLAERMLALLDARVRPLVRGADPRRGPP